MCGWIVRHAGSLVMSWSVTPWFRSLKSTCQPRMMAGISRAVITTHYCYGRERCRVTEVMLDASIVSVMNKNEYGAYAVFYYLLTYFYMTVNGKSH